MKLGQLQKPTDPYSYKAERPSLKGQELLDHDKKWLVFDYIEPAKL